MSLCLKDIKNALRSLKMEGRHVGELEGLLISSDDLTELLRTIPEYKNGMSRDGIRLFGIKMIESRYTQKGTILRIFKADEKPSFSQSKKIKQNWQSTVTDNGVIQMPDHMKLPTMADSKKKDKRQKRHSMKRKIELD